MPLSVNNGDIQKVHRTVDAFGNVARAALVEAILAGEAATWERAARRYEAARPRLGEFHGSRTRVELRAKWVELTELARACRSRARLLTPAEAVAAEVDVILGEAS